METQQTHSRRAALHVDVPNRQQQAVWVSKQQHQGQHCTVHKAAELKDGAYPAILQASPRDDFAVKHV
jgi:hypothetical protein